MTNNYKDVRAFYYLMLLIIQLVLRQIYLICPLLCLSVCVCCFRARRQYLGEKQRCKNDVYKRCYSLSNGTVSNVILRNLYLQFQGQQYEMLIYQIQ